MIFMKLKNRSTINIEHIDSKTEDQWLRSTCLIKYTGRF